VSALEISVVFFSF